MNIVKVACTSCGAPMKIQSGQDTATCPYCGNSIVIERPADIAEQVNRAVAAQLKNQPQSLSSKEWNVTLILCALFGFLGLHRFYTGHFVWGIVLLLTSGGFGMGWLVDLFLALTNRYTDSAGKPLRGYSPRVGRAGLGALAIFIITLILGIIGLAVLNQFIALISLSINSLSITQLPLTLAIGASFLLAFITFFYAIIVPTPFWESLWQKLLNK